MRDSTRLKYTRKTVLVDAGFVYAVACKGDEDAIALDELMRARDLGSVFVQWRVGDDNVFKLAHRMIAASIWDASPTRGKFIHGAGHA